MGGHFDFFFSTLDEEISMMISQVNFARPWDMSGNGNANCNNDNHLTSSKLGLAPLQVSDCLFLF